MQPDGTLIMSPTSPAIYLIEGGQRRWIPDPTTFEAMGFRWENVQTLPDVAVNQIPLGPPLPPIHRLAIHVDTFLGAGHYMTTDATLANGVLKAITRTRTVTWLGGFTGGVHVVLADANDIVIGTSNQQTFGVDGTFIGRSDRTEHWSENIDPDIARRTARLGVVHAWAPKVDTAEMVRRAIEIGKVIWELIAEANQEDGSGAGTS
jgi:hypothetical protein